MATVSVLDLGFLRSSPRAFANNNIQYPWPKTQLELFFCLPGYHLVSKLVYPCLPTGNLIAGNEADHCLSHALSQALFVTLALRVAQAMMLRMALAPAQPSL